MARIPWAEAEVEAVKRWGWASFHAMFPKRSHSAYRAKKWTLEKDGLIPEDQRWAAPTYTDFERMEGDVVVTGDWHIPFTDWEFAGEVIEVGKFLGVKQLLIGGDLFDFDALKYFTKMGVPVPLDVEINLANATVDALRAHYDKIVIIRGNHETRYLRMLGTWTAMQGLLEAKPPEVIFSDYAYCLIDTPLGTYRATHPKNYSVVKNAVAQRLADRFVDQSIINFHGHFTDQAPSKEGKRACISCGCMLDPDTVAYKKLDDTTHPEWNVSFGAIMDGRWLSHNKTCPHLDNLGWYMSR